MLNRLPRTGSMAAAAALLLLVGCGPDRARPAWTDMYSLELRSQDAAIATWTLSGGWDEEALPEIPAQLPWPSLSLRVAAFDVRGEVIPFLGEPDHSIAYRLSEGASEGVLDMERTLEELSEVDRVHLWGKGSGTTRIELTLLHGGRVRQWTTPISVTVAE